MVKLVKVAACQMLLNGCSPEEAGSHATLPFKNLENPNQQKPQYSCFKIYMKICYFSIWTLKSTGAGELEGVGSQRSLASGRDTFSAWETHRKAFVFTHLQLVCIRHNPIHDNVYMKMGDDY